MNVLIAGATGYLGKELIKNLIKHKKLKLNIYVETIQLEKKLQILINQLNQTTINYKFNKSKINECDIIFSALPNGEAQIISKN